MGVVVEQRTVEPVVGLPVEEYERITRRIRSVVDEVTAALAKHVDAEAADPGEKPGDIEDETRCRSRYLRRVQAGQMAGALIADMAAQCAASDATTAVWLNASLADLGAVTGSTRQAARKRWPQLGRVHRARKWIGNHPDDLLWAMDLLLQHTTGLQAAEPDREEFESAVDALRRGVAEVRADIEYGSVLGATQRIVRWQRFDRLVDDHLRTVVSLGLPSTPDAEFAVHGARGVLRYYDHAVTA